MSPKRAKLDREMILERALQMLEDRGPDGFGLRQLALSLDVSAPALYVYFDSKRDLLDEVIARITNNVAVGSFDTEPWDVALRTWGLSYYEIVSAHPRLVSLIATLPGQRPEWLQRAVRIQAGLVRGGWPAEDATQISWMVRYLVLGASVTMPESHYSTDRSVYELSYPNLSHVPEMVERESSLGRDVFVMSLDLLIRQLRAAHPVLPRDLDPLAAGAASKAAPDHV